MNRSIDDIMGPAFASDAIQAAYAGFPTPARESLLVVRGWVFEIASERADIGTISESLKWGQPSYATQPKTGCPLRLGMNRQASLCAVFVPCQTSLIEALRAHYDGVRNSGFSFDGNRAMLFAPGKMLPEVELRHAITMALTYYLR